MSNEELADSAPRRGSAGPSSRTLAAPHASKVDPSVPAWWAQLQGEFGAMLRTPLRTERGRFEPDPDACSPALRAALERSTALAGGSEPGVVERLEVYQSQYWMRLFNTMQTAFRRLTHVLGPWRFNHLAQIHLSERPPAHHDLDQCANGFHGRIGRALQGMAAGRTSSRGAYEVDQTRLCDLPLDERARTDPCCQQLARSPAPLTLVRQALSMDEAQRRAMLAGSFVRWEQPIVDPDRLAPCRLRFSASFSLVREDWELAALGYRKPATTRAVEVSQHPHPHYWVFHRGPRAVGSVRVHPIFARLLARAAKETVGEALEAVRAACKPDQRSQLEQELGRWLRLGAESGWWVGVT
ncbi:MAG: putative DNA-binding domain-containing protein [Myxococcota bacterium]